MYLPDTNVFSEYFKAIPNQNVLNKLKQYEYQTNLAVIVWQELLFGVLRMLEGKRKQGFLTFLNDKIARLPLFIYDKDVGDINAKIRSDCEKKGKTLAYSDSQIASIALANDLTVVTRNISDFIAIDGLKVVDWFE